MITNKIKIIAGIIIVVISLLVWQNHNNNKYQQLKGEYDVLKEQYEANNCYTWFLYFTKGVLYQ